MTHTLFDEGIFAFVRPSPGTDLRREDVMDHCKSIASYKRPQHIEIWPADRDLPLTRSAKVDKMALIELAENIVEDLRKNKQWDADVPFKSPRL
jgi:acyl-coenzyme A synthetase/AMP-(fatty) acid ligase